MFGCGVGEAGPGKNRKAKRALRRGRLGSVRLEGGRKGGRKEGRKGGKEGGREGRRAIFCSHRSRGGLLDKAHSSPPLSRWWLTSSHTKKLGDKRVGKVGDKLFTRKMLWNSYKKSTLIRIFLVSIGKPRRAIDPRIFWSKN